MINLANSNLMNLWSYSREFPFQSEIFIEKQGYIVLKNFINVIFKITFYQIIGAEKHTKNYELNLVG